jgi:ribonuclease HII
MNNIFNEKNTYEIGVDEAGRGPLFGRVYTAAVVLPKDLDCKDIKDSKRFSSEKKIRKVYEYIKENALFYSIDYVSEQEIDKLNIREATILCMKKSIHAVLNKINYDFTFEIDIMIDGTDFNYLTYYYDKQINDISVNMIKKGDSKFYNIAAASILAKVSRDEYIYELCDLDITLDNYYLLKKNKGYGTKDHLNGIKNHGLSKYHRKSFHIKNLN